MVVFCVLEAQKNLKIQQKAVSLRYLFWGCTKRQEYDFVRKKSMEFPWFTLLSSGVDVF